MDRRSKRHYGSSSSHAKGWGSIRPWEERRPNREEGRRGLVAHAMGDEVSQRVMADSPGAGGGDVRQFGMGLGGTESSGWGNA